MPALTAVRGSPRATLGEGDVAALVALFARLHARYSEAAAGGVPPVLSGVTHDHLPFEWSISLRQGAVTEWRFIHDLPPGRELAAALGAMADFAPVPPACRALVAAAERCAPRPAFRGNFTWWVGAGIGSGTPQLKLYVNPWAYCGSFTELGAGRYFGYVPTLADLARLVAIMGAFDAAEPSMIGWNFAGDIATAKLYLRVPRASLSQISAFLFQTGRSDLAGNLAEMVSAHWMGEAHLYFESGAADEWGTLKVNLNVATTGTPSRPGRIRPADPVLEAIADRFRASVDLPKGGVEVTWVSANRRKRDVYFKPGAADAASSARADGGVPLPT